MRHFRSRAQQTPMFRPPGRGRFSRENRGCPGFRSGFRYPRAAGPDPDLDSLSADQTVEIVGKMGRLMGGPETIFSIRTPHGSEFECLATKETTSGYGAIAIRQYARVKPYVFPIKCQVSSSNTACRAHHNYWCLNTPSWLTRSTLSDPDDLKPTWTSKQHAGVVRAAAVPDDAGRLLAGPGGSIERGATQTTCRLIPGDLVDSGRGPPCLRTRPEK